MLGKGTIILVMGAAVILTMLILNLNSNATSEVETSIDYYNQTQARLISNSGVEIYLEKLRRDKSLRGTFPDNDLMGGEYNIYISGPDSQLVIKSTATTNKLKHTSIVTASRDKVAMPNVSSALYVYADNINLHLNGNVDINGNDHKIDGSPGTAAPLPGIGVDQPADSSFVVNNIKPQITKSILGEGPEPSVRTINDNTDWLTLTENMIFSADTTLYTGTYSNGATFGSLNDPIITYCDGNVNFTDATGYGIMIINGNITLSGNFNFYGIVIVYGQSTIRTQTIGNNSIYGGTILVGQDVSIESQGNASFYYSSEAISNAHFNLKSSRFKILSWWE